MITPSEVKAKQSAAHAGSRHPGWLGDEAGYRAIHQYLNKRNPKTGVCEECGKAARITHFAVIHGHPYSRNREDYRELCPRCHMRYDLGAIPLGPEVKAKISAARKTAWERNRRNGTVHEAPHGEDCVQTKLTDVVVAEMRRRHAGGETIASLAAGYGVSPRAAGRAIAGITWKHVAD